MADGQTQLDTGDRRTDAAPVLDSVELGTGAWQWGDQFYWGFGRSYAAADVRGAFDASLAAGVTFFDTAEVYGMGRSEKLLGEFARSGSRPAVIVATKFMPLPWRWTKGSLLRALRHSLSRLDVPRVDLYQIHWPFPPMSIEWWMDALAEAVQVGLARAVGVSNFDVEQTRRAHAALARRGVPLASNQVPYSLLNRGVEKSGLVALCRELGVRVIAYSPIEKGILSGKYSAKNPPPGPRGRLYSAEYMTRSQPLISVMRNLGMAHGGKTPTQVALNWLICKGALPIPGAKNAQQAQENTGALGWRLTPSEVSALEATSEQI
jgi:aryl-alcohol dehydrogenase-like predicted oxidoreductase